MGTTPEKLTAEVITSLRLVALHLEMAEAYSPEENLQLFKSLTEGAFGDPGTDEVIKILSAAERSIKVLREKLIKQDRLWKEI